MPDNQVYSLKIETITGEGAGLARLNGKSVFVEGAIPGETVICSLLSEQKTWAKARLLDIAEESADRIKPACVYYAQCGGCNMQHVDYPAQLKFKASKLKDSFLRHGVNPPDPEIVPCEPWEYRNKMQFRLAPETREKRMQKLSAKSVPNFALMARGGGIIPVSDCPIADPGIRKILQNAEERKKALPGPEKDRFNVYYRNGLLLIEGGRERGKTELLGREIALDAKFFFQSNGAMLERLIADLIAVAGHAAKKEPMADIFCGVGTFAAFLRELFSGADLVEENRGAIAIAKENVKSAGFFAQKDTVWARERRAHKYGFIVVDPPRGGLGAETAKWLLENGPPVLAYVSCEPFTLGRDSRILCQNYTISRVVFYDFYPQTSNIESLTVFVK